MTYRQFVVPNDADFADAFGAVVESVDGEEEYVRSVTLTTASGASLVLVYDSIGRSVSVRLVDSGVILLDLYREGATLLSVESARGSTGVVVAFETEELAGKLVVQIFPDLKVSDTMLFA